MTIKTYDEMVTARGYEDHDMKLDALGTEDVKEQVKSESMYRNYWGDRQSSFACAKQGNYALYIEDNKIRIQDWSKGALKATTIFEGDLLGLVDAILVEKKCNGDI